MTNPVSDKMPSKSYQREQRIPNPIAYISYLVLDEPSRVYYRHTVPTWGMGEPIVFLQQKFLHLSAVKRTPFHLPTRDPSKEKKTFFPPPPGAKVSYELFVPEEDGG